MFVALLLFLHSQVFASEFRVRLVADPQTLDWTLATSTMESLVLMNIMEGLFEFTPDMKVRPALVSSYSISKDNKTYVFKLKAGVKWSDGKNLEAQDFAYSWKRLLDPLTGAAYAYFLFPIVGAEDYHTGQIKDFSKVGIKALDTNTLEVKIKNPVPYFLQLLTFWITYPLRKDIVEVHGTQWTKPENIVVLGPFIPTKNQPQSEIILKRNDKYYGKRPQLEIIKMAIINEDATALNLFKTKKLDFTMPINFLEAGDLVKTPAYHVAHYFRTSYLGFNTSRYPLNLPKVRQAVAMAIDKSKIGEVMYEEKESARSLLPTELFPEGRNIGLAFDPNKAKKLIEEVGLDPKTIPKLDLVGFASDQNALLTQYLQDQLKKHLGFEIEIRLPEFKTYRTHLDLRNGGLFYMSWGADYADPDTFFGVFLSDSGNNRMQWKNPSYDALVKKAAITTEHAQRIKLYRQALEILLIQDVAVVPLHYNSIMYLLNPRFQNFVINPLKYVYFRDIVVGP